ncbi:Alcohol dehydrogenase-like [Arachis hypogaea]|nr:Alcohol dehydrogenase-like [Arachis hypogaea]
MSLMEGLGAAWNVANVTKGSTGVIFGLGTVGLSTGVLPSFVPFAQAFAVVLTAVLTGSLYYVAASPKDPTYTVAPVLQSRSGRQDLKKLFEGSITYPCSKALESVHRFID